MFHNAPSRSRPEVEERRHALKDLCKFGINFLDDAAVGISPHDLVVVGAPSGAGKTEFCCRLALANMAEGKNVHFIALEAEPDEIERRLKYQIFAERYFSDPRRPRVEQRITYKYWRLGYFLDSLKEYEDYATDFFERTYRSLFVAYKPEEFGIAQLIEAVCLAANDTSLIIIDHVHFFDFQTDNENREVKEIASTARKLAIDIGKPIVLVSHLRKRDRQNQDLVAGLDEFHGSSDLTKIATKVISLAPGSPTQSGKFETFFRIAKDRTIGGLNRYIGRVTFDPRQNTYSDEYRVGLATCTRNTGFEELTPDAYPEWAKVPPVNGSHGD